MHGADDRAKIREIGCVPDFFMRITSALTGLQSGYTGISWQKNYQKCLVRQSMKLR